MNKNIEQLYQKSRKATKRIIGLMSGTSLDGLDIALCRITGSGFRTEIVLEKFSTIPYDIDFKKQIKEVFSKQQVSLEKLCLLNPWVANIHGCMILDVLKKWDVQPDEVDFIASHGQTVYHAPISLHGKKEFPNATLQIGDGDHLAHKTGIITLSDFRQKQLAAGGEGAPLALYGDFLLFRDTTESRILLNLGGISNFTFIPSNANFSEVLCTDVGPGNTLMDAYMQRFFDVAYDKDAKVAAQGNVNQQLLKALLNNPYFSLELPKTTGPETFNLQFLEAAQRQSSTTNISKEDVMRTLAELTVQSIVDCIEKNISTSKNMVIYLSGGGASNPLIGSLLKQYLPMMSIQNTDKLGINPDAKEAILFALLANESLSNSKKLEGTKKYPWVAMGKISFPL